MKFIFLAIAIIVILSSCDKKTNFKNYLTYKDASEDGAIEKGWVPDFLPNSSTDIYEKHDVDANQIAVKFSSHDTAFLSKLKIITKDMHDEAFILFNSAEFPELDGNNPSFYYLRCTQEGAGILATDGNEKFYYIEPVGRYFEPECTAD